ncbi:MAG: right-handed parallel beta-helix repeat-containing protein [Pseudomonadota bacterium]
MNPSQPYFSTLSADASDAGTAATTVLPLPTGAVVGGYEIGDAIARGGTSLVYTGRSLQLGRPITLKEFCPPQICHRQTGETVQPLPEAQGVFNEALSDFGTEARFQAMVEHPNVQRAIDLIEANGTAYLITDGSSGHSLQNMLERDTAPSDSASLLTLAHQMLDALEAIHSYGLVHGDVKPGNIILAGPIASRPRYLLGDFGSAFLASDGHPDTVTATPDFAAPELMTGKGACGPWSDLFSLGAVLFRLATGLSAGNLTPKAAAASFDHLPAALGDTILRALKAKPSARFPAAAVWREALSQGEPAPLPSARSVEPAPEQHTQTTEQTGVVRVKAGSKKTTKNLTVEPVAAEQAPPAQPPTPSPPPAGSVSATPVRDDLPATVKITRHSGTVPPLPPFRARKQASEAPRPTRGPARKRQAGTPIQAAQHRSHPAKKRSGFGRVAAVLLVAAGLGAGGYFGYPRYADWSRDVWIVAPDGTGHATTIANALERAREGVQVRIQPGTYPESLALQKAVTLVGDPAEDGTLPILAPEGGAAITTDANTEAVALESLLVDGAQAPDMACMELGGGAVAARGVTLSNCGTGGVFVGAGTGASFENVIVEAPSGPGIRVLEGGSARIDQGQIVASAASGIIVRAGAEMALKDTMIEQPGQAGVLVLGTATIDNVTIRRSSTSGLEIRDGGTATVTGGSIVDGRGAGLFVLRGGTGEITGLTIHRNRFSGVIIGDGGEPSLENVVITENAEHGVYLLPGSSGNLTNTLITGNTGHAVSSADGAGTQFQGTTASGNREPQYLGIELSNADPVEPLASSTELEAVSQ